MPTIQVQTPPTDSQQPITLPEAIAQLRLDLDPATGDVAQQGQLALLTIYIAAAREQVEGYTGRYLAPVTLRLTFTLGEPYVLPAGATATAVEGVFTDLDALANRASYLSEYYKGISISRDLDWADALQQTYTVTATVAGVTVPALARQAMLELVAEMYEQRTPTADLTASWRVRLAPLVLNPVGDGY